MKELNYSNSKVYYLFNAVKLKHVKVFILLFFIDFVFLLLHIANQLDLFDMRNKISYSIAVDGSYGELYQYIKELSIALLLIFIGIRTSKKIYFSWSILFIYFLLDDSLQIHENFGNYLSNYFLLHGSYGLRAQDYGELLVSIFFGTIIFAIIGWFYFRSKQESKDVSKIIFFLILTLMIFGIGFDLIDVIIPISFWQAVFALIEDGGEMIVMSMILGYVYNLSRSD